MGLMERLKYGKIVDGEPFDTKKELLDRVEELKKEIESDKVKIEVDDYLRLPGANFGGPTSHKRKVNIFKGVLSLNDAYDKIDEFLGYVPKESSGKFFLRRRKKGNTNYIGLHTKRWSAINSILPEKYNRVLAHSYDIRIYG